MPVYGARQAILPPKHQTDATLNQAAPVQNQWYTVLDTTLNVRLYAITTAILNVGETVGLRITIDGQTLSGSFAQVANQWYWWALRDGDAYSAVPAASTTMQQVIPHGPMDCRSLKVEMRKTTAVGNENLQSHVQYAKW